MSEDMSLSVNGQSQVPPGFRFHPTEEELLHYYLKKKVAYEKIDLDVIRDVDLNKLEPWDIQVKCKIGSTPQNDWYFFSHKDKKYPTGTRTNRATAAGFWKATGRDKVIYSSFKRIGMRKTLVFYKGRAPHGQKSDWIMHEYRLDDNAVESNVSSNSLIVEGIQEEGWVVCRVFKKKNHQKSVDGPVNNNNSISSSSMMISKTQLLNSTSSSDGALDQIIHYLGRTCKQESENNTRFLRQFGRVINDGGVISDRFMQLPALESPTTLQSSSSLHHHTSNNRILDQEMDSIVYESSIISNQSNNIDEHIYEPAGGLSDWAALDCVVASHFNNSQSETSKQFAAACFSDSSSLGGFSTSGNENQELVHHYQSPPQQHQIRQLATRPSSSMFQTSHVIDYNSEIDLWNFAAGSNRYSSSSMTDPLCSSHVSNPST
ncbi:hypothetical protein C5167_030973 [Papaver somniferum]|uniref:NAC domain-containing protein 43-like n=1 Tax=Papaver somniferum TaxID=3469 RepID=UPI000E6FCE82|nr:NAC domain-containing protein 43-like [Papaver somniferum]RZC89282.1 hypothetical protein C5167_030973 [Papaver somniferum]